MQSLAGQGDQTAYNTDQINMNSKFQTAKLPCTCQSESLKCLEFTGLLRRNKKTQGFDALRSLYYRGVTFSACGPFWP